MWAGAWRGRGLWACGKKSTFGRQILYRVMEKGAKNLLNADFSPFLSQDGCLSCYETSPQSLAVVVGWLLCVCVSPYLEDD